MSRLRYTLQCEGRVFEPGGTHWRVGTPLREIVQPASEFIDDAVLVDRVQSHGVVRVTIPLTALRDVTHGRPLSVTAIEKTLDVMLAEVLEETATGARRITDGKDRLVLILDMLPQEEVDVTERNSEDAHLAGYDDRKDCTTLAVLPRVSIVGQRRRPGLLGGRWRRVRLVPTRGEGG